MSTATPAIQLLARRLIALEAARPSVESSDEVARACNRLRGSLAKLAGEAGFRSLLSRALALAKAKSPWLAPVKVREDGTLEGFDEARNHPDAPPGHEAGNIVVSHLLGFLMTFIGEPLTLGLVRDAWPDLAVNDFNPSVEEKR